MYKALLIFAIILLIIYYLCLWVGVLKKFLKDYRYRKRIKKERNIIDELFEAGLNLANANSSNRHNFLFETTENFYNNLNEDYEKLNYCIQLICKFIDYRGPILMAIFAKDKFEGPARLVGTNIEIKKEYIKKKYELGAILANIITYAYIKHNKYNYLIDSKYSGYFLDIVCFCLGLGKLKLNGLIQNVNSSTRYLFWFDSRSWFVRKTDFYSWESSHYGSVTFYSLLYLYEKYRIYKYIKYSLALKNIRYRFKSILLKLNLIVRWRATLRAVKRNREFKKSKFFYEDDAVKTKYFKCNYCGESLHSLDSECMGVEKWICNSCKRIKVIEVF